MPQETLEKVVEINKFRRAALSSDENARLKVLREIQALVRTNHGRATFGIIGEERLTRSDLDYAAERCYTAMIDIIRGRITPQYEHGQSLNLEYALEGFQLEERERSLINQFGEQWYNRGKAEYLFEQAAERTRISGKFAMVVGTITMGVIATLGLAADDPDIPKVITSSIIAGGTFGAGAYALEKFFGYPITQKRTGLKAPEPSPHEFYSLRGETVKQLMEYHRLSVRA